MCYMKDVIQKKIRVHRKDSAFTYAILESLEGMASYSTLPDEPGQNYRDLALCIPEPFVLDIEIVLNGLRKKFSVLELS